MPSLDFTADNPLCLSFDNNRLLPSLYGDCDKHLEAIEKHIHVKAASRGNMVSIQGKKKDAERARIVLEHLYQQLEQGMMITDKEVEAAIRMVSEKGNMTADDQRKLLDDNGRVEIKTRKKAIHPYTNRQAEYAKQLREYDVCFAVGPAGTGKTYMAVAIAVAMFLEGKVSRIILTRPAVEAGEKLGFLPGDLKDKIDPYLRPLYDALQDMLPAEKVMEYMENGTFEVAPLAFMRGRTLSSAFVILDEAQNTTPTQMKMFLTRLGEHSRMAVTGDVSQTDLPAGMLSGLTDAITRLEGVEGIAITRFGDTDVVRHPLAARIIQAYDKTDKAKAKATKKPEHA